MKLNRALLMGLVAISALTASALALCHPANMVDTTYYSDAAMTTPVGEYVLTCTGWHGMVWGETSGYHSSTTIPCDPPHSGGCTPAQLGCGDP